MNLLEKEIPGNVSGVCETSLCHLSSYRVDDRCLLLVLEQMADGSPGDKLDQEDEEVFRQQLLLV